MVVGSTPADHSWLAAARQQLTTTPAPVAISYLADRSLQQVLEQVAQLPDRTVVLIGAFQRDATGQDFRTRDVVERIAQVSRAPVYVLQDHSVGGGIVGGHVVSFHAQGVRAAELALRVLAAIDLARPTARRLLRVRLAPARALGARRAAAAGRERRALPGAPSGIRTAGRWSAASRWSRSRRAHRRSAREPASAGGLSGRSPSACGSRRSSPSSRPRSRPAGGGRWTGRSRRRSGASWRSWTSIGPRSLALSRRPTWSG